MARLLQRRWALFVPLVVVGLGMAAVVGWYFLRESEPTPWDKPAAVDGSTVSLTYTGSSCRDSVEVDVDETPTSVIITLREEIRASSCSDVGVSYDVEVSLDAPVAERELLDGACQMAEYAGRSECA